MGKIFCKTMLPKFLSHGSGKPLGTYSKLCLAKSNGDSHVAVCASCSPSCSLNKVKSLRTDSVAEVNIHERGWSDSRWRVNGSATDNGVAFRRTVCEKASIQRTISSECSSRHWVNCSDSCSKRVDNCSMVSARSHTGSMILSVSLMVVCNLSKASQIGELSGNCATLQRPLDSPQAMRTSLAARSNTSLTSRQSAASRTWVMPSA